MKEKKRKSRKLTSALLYFISFYKMRKTYRSIYLNLTCRIAIRFQTGNTARGVEYALPKEQGFSFENHYFLFISTLSSNVDFILSDGHRVLDRVQRGSTFTGNELILCSKTDKGTNRQQFGMPPLLYSYPGPRRPTSIWNPAASLEAPMNGGENLSPVTLIMTRFPSSFHQ